MFPHIHLHRLLGVTLLFATFGAVSAKGQGQPTAPAAIQLPESPDQLDTIQKYPDCVANQHAGYKGGQCKVLIWRSVPISPPTLMVPSSTTVHVVLFDARQNENTTFTLSSTLTTPHAYGSTILQNVIPGLSLITETAPIQPNLRAGEAIDEFTATVPGAAGAKTLASSIKNRQEELVDSTNSVLSKVQNAAEGMTCLSNYERLDKSKSIYSCSQAVMLKYEDFLSAKIDAFGLIDTAAKAPLRVNDVSDLDSVVKSFYLTCLSEFPNMGRSQEDNGANQGANTDAEAAQVFCRKEAEFLSTREAEIDTAISDIQKAEDTAVQNEETLKAFDTPPRTVVYKFTAPKLTNLTVTIAGNEIVSKTNTTIAALTINQQATHIVLSTGIGFSNLKFNTYATSPVISNGQPVLNNGTGETIVTGTSTSFSVITPLVLVDYRFNRLSNYRWETRCPNGCSFLFGGGAGANLTAKEADFDVGPSFEIGNVLFTAALHIGRETHLDDGITVGEMPSPAMTLPTKTRTAFKFAFAITYSIPIPNF